MDKFIFRKRNALNSQQCEDAINLYKHNPDLHTPNSRGYTGIMCSFNDPIFITLKEIIFKNFELYKSKHPFLEKITWGVDEPFLIQKYEIGRSFSSEHCEHGPYDYDCRRMMGWMIYLNTLKNKGGTAFPQQRFTTNPRKGDMYIWPSSWTHSHYGIEAPKETKYIITGWAGFPRL